MSDRNHLLVAFSIFFMQFFLVSLYYKKEIVTGANIRFDSMGDRILKKYGSNFKCVVTKGNRPNWCPPDNCIELSGYNGKVGRFKVWLRLSSFLSKQRNAFVLNDFVPVPVKLFSRGVVLIQLVHDLRNFDGFGRGGLGKFSSLFQKLQYKLPDYFTSVSYDTKNQLVDKCNIDDSKVLVSYNGIALETKFSKIRDIDIFYVATFEPRKNHVKLLEALERIVEPLNVLFIGRDLGLLEMVKVKAESIKHHSIEFISHVSEQDLSMAYARAKVFCSPSLYEGFGIPVIEGMINECAVVCSDIDVFREVTLGEASYFDPNSVDSIKDSLKKALVSYELKESRDKRKLISEKVRQQFSWDEIVEKFCLDLEKLRSKF